MQYPSNKYNQMKLLALSNKVMDNFNKLMNHLNINLHTSNSFLYGPCPVHGGDKYNAVNVFHATSQRGKWKCYTRQCEQYFNNSVIGFIRGILSHRKYNWCHPQDKKVGFNRTIQFLLTFLDEDYDNLDITISSKEQDKNEFIKSTNNKTPKTNNTNITRNQIRSTLEIPAKYYLDRGYTDYILDRYDVGQCIIPCRTMYQRVIIPIYDENYKYVGCTGRSIFERCKACKCWHDTTKACTKSPKWLHSKGLNKNQFLYNYWYSKPHIKQTRVAIIVEGPGDIWKLEEAGIYNSVAILGTNLSESQQIILDASGTMALILLTDQDKAGLKAKEDISKACKKMYHIYTPTFSQNDIGTMSVRNINKELKPIINDIIKEQK